MKLVRILFFLLISALIFINPVHSHKRALYDIIIDTDCGVDDFRSMTYFLASRDFNINAITSVDGVFATQEGANYISMLLDKYQHQGIPVGQGRENNSDKKYRSHAKPQWDRIFPRPSNKTFPDAVEIMFTALKNSRKTTILVAMGPLTNTADLLRKHPEILPKIEMIFWYSGFDDKPRGHNYSADPEAYEFLFENNIPMKIISGKGHEYSEAFVDIAKEIENSVYAETFVDFMQGFNLRYYWDDIMPFYLIYTMLFDEKRVYPNVIIVEPKPEAMFDILATTILNYDKPDEGVIFNEVPTQGYMLRSDLHGHVEEILSAHGYQEFKIVALTSEIHSHLGIYSIVGAKLGLRIMEYLHVGLDEVRIISYAGQRPPISCLNDGLQVGTGATIGYGAITSEKTDNPKASAKVIYNNRKILFTLKPEIAEDIEQTIVNLVRTYGLNSEMYWDELRKISIEYWKNINRFEAFDIEVL